MTSSETETSETEIVSSEIEIQTGRDCDLNLWGVDLLPVVKTQLNWGQESLSLCSHSLKSLTRPGFPEHHIQPGRAAPSTSPAAPSHPVGTHGPTVKQALTPEMSPFPINLSSNEMEIYQRELLEKANLTETAEIGKHWEPNPALPIKLMRCARAQTRRLRGQDTEIPALITGLRQPSLLWLGAATTCDHCATRPPCPCPASSPRGWAGSDGSVGSGAGPTPPGRENNSLHPPAVPRGGTETSGCSSCHFHSSHWTVLPVSASTVCNTPRNAEISSSVVHKHHNIILGASKPIPTTNPTDKQS